MIDFFKCVTCFIEFLIVGEYRFINLYEFTNLSE